MIPVVNSADSYRVRQWSWRKADERQAQEEEGGEGAGGDF
jgi:hypothetical protein